MEDISKCFLRSSNDKYLIIADILDIESNYFGTYMIVKRVPMITYDCEEDESMKTFSINILQYMIINKETNDIFQTYIKDEYLQKKEALKITLEFKISDESI